DMLEFGFIVFLRHDGIRDGSVSCFFFFYVPVSSVDESLFLNCRLIDPIEVSYSCFGLSQSLSFPPWRSKVPEQPGAVKGAPVLGAAQRTLVPLTGQSRPHR